MGTKSWGQSDVSNFGLPPWLGVSARFTEGRCCESQPAAKGGEEWKRVLHQVSILYGRFVWSAITQSTLPTTGMSYSFAPLVP